MPEITPANDDDPEPELPIVRLLLPNEIAPPPASDPTWNSFTVTAERSEFAMRWDAGLPGVWTSA